MNIQYTIHNDVTVNGDRFVSVNGQNAIDYYKTLTDILGFTLPLGFKGYIKEIDITIELISDYGTEYHRELCNTCLHSKGGLAPSHNGSIDCMSGSIASGGSTKHCTCDVCF